VIAVVNLMIEARTKGGALDWRDSLIDFFAPLAAIPLSHDGFLTDPKIVYDAHEGRFVVLTLEVFIGTASVSPTNTSRILLAVSKTGNPRTPTAADWNYLAIDAKEVIPRPVALFDHWAD
jgi:hypothetical protein